MSLPDDYGPCRCCGSLTDSGVCSAACADQLDAELRQRSWPECEGCDACLPCVRLVGEGTALGETAQCHHCRGVSPGECVDCDDEGMAS